MRRWIKPVIVPALLGQGIDTGVRTLRELAVLLDLLRHHFLGKSFGGVADTRCDERRVSF